MSSYSEFFLNSASSVVQLELIEISHPSFSQTYRIVRNNSEGVTVIVEDGSSQFFEYYPLKITYNGQKDDLDQSFNITLGDLGEIIPMELDNIALSNTFLTKPTLIYRTYRSDDLTTPLLDGFNMQIQAFSFNKEGVTFEAKAPSINVNSTGLTYTLASFPMLRAYL